MIDYRKRGGLSARTESNWVSDKHQVVCRGCGTSADVDCAMGQVPCVEPSQANGFVVDKAEITFWGTCPACRQDSND